MFSSSIGAARWPLFVVSAGLGALLAGCGGGGTNLPTPGSGQGGLGDNGNNNGGVTLGANSIVFVSTRDGNPEIYSINADGTNAKRLTEDPATDEQPSRSRDGQRIVFSSQRDGNAEIYVMNADGSAPQRLTNDVGPVADRPTDERPVFSPDGTRIEWQSTRGGVRRLFTMDATGANQRPVTFADATQPSFDGSWNPDSKRLLGFLVNPGDNGLNDLALITPATAANTAATGTSTFQILRAGTNAAHPRYSPDGSRIVVFNAPTLGLARLQLLDANGQNPTNGPSGGTNQLGPSFSPNGNRIVWDANPVANAPQRQLYVATIGTAAAPGVGAPITTQGENYDASWSQ